MFRSNRPTQEQKDRILQRKFLTNDLNNCQQQEFTRHFDYQMCLFRQDNPFECREVGKKLAGKKAECKAINTKIEELDREIFPPKPGQRG